MSGWVMPVEVSGMDLGCCGGPLEIGDRVEWGLWFTDRSVDAVAPPVEHFWSATALPTEAPAWTAVLLSAGPARATWTDDTGRRLPEGRQRLTGHLSATWHGGGVVEDPPTTTGRIQRIQQASRLFQLVTEAPRGRSWSWSAGIDGVLVGVPGSTELLDVDTAPGTEPEFVGPRRGDTTYRGPAGWVVDLAVDR